MDEGSVNEEDLVIPFAMCGDCDVYVPVLFREFDFDDEVTMDIIACPLCFGILNMDNDVELEYYALEEVEGLGYRVVKEEEGRGPSREEE